MTLTEITEQIRSTAAKAPSLGKALKFQFDEGVVHVDMTGSVPVVTNEDKDADTTIIASIDTFNSLRKGDLNPMMAVMTGKVKIKGDMGLALKLQSLVG
ncbi:MAG TPA: SCP2 sterol-binding domain-containing protein [Flavilitoribacter sp.]|nr:SCP2 sterol-binding domain-containing protein [Flavilitoribacter sp.]HMQ89795.1 SCP2 sterol-binding domain-containing protein [Flavilitoribacter sp.]